ncbi:hypothetical protein [Vibrio tetraodonis]|uniref:hypothetical protein n=1 Tax=Vibrio tetraodonis TaxID=2231647 RepID=UPI000E0C48CF|nr:hypothetical protein [Vibrio tetraodonis]
MKVDGQNQRINGYCSRSFIHWDEASREEEVRLHYCLYQGERNGKPTTSKRMRKIGFAVDKIVNCSGGVQNLFERFLRGYIGGFEEVYFKLKAVK